MVGICIKEMDGRDKKKEPNIETICLEFDIQHWDPSSIFIDAPR
jgi:hypothetical protein